MKFIHQIGWWVEGTCLSEVARDVSVTVTVSVTTTADSGMWITPRLVHGPVLYRAGNLVTDLGWVDSVLCCSAVCQIYWGRWKSGSIAIAVIERWWNRQDHCHSNPGPRPDAPPCFACRFFSTQKKGVHADGTTVTRQLSRVPWNLTLISFLELDCYIVQHICPQCQQPTSIFRRTCMR